MSKSLIGPELQRVIDLVGKLPGLGPRSARRVALQLLKRKDALLIPLAEALAEAAKKITKCSTCGTWDTTDPCTVCAASNRDLSVICVVQDVPDAPAHSKAATIFWAGSCLHLMALALTNSISTIWSCAPRSPK